MKKTAWFFLAFFFFFSSLPAAFAKDARETPPNTNTGSTPPPSGGEGQNLGYGPERDSGIFLGGDTGAFIPLGYASHALTPQFLSSVDFGYILKRRLSFQLRLLTGYGQTERTGAGTFLFMLEYDTKFNFLKKSAFSPFIMGGVGMYVLSFSGFDPFISNGTNLTFVGGGGFDYNFGSNSVGLDINYRGFLNSVHYFEGLETLVSYTYHFF
jgi:hypothetical protein